VLVLPAVYWAKVGGFLWWRRWGNARTTADVWVSAGAVRRPYHLGWFMDDVLTEMLDLWDAGRLVVGKERSYDVLWLDPSESALVAREVFGLDIEQERERRTS
jgi:hypothetical protein